jgi:hypothetical protein
MSNPALYNSGTRLEKKIATFITSSQKMSFLTRISGSIRPFAFSASRYYTTGAAASGKCLFFRDLNPFKKMTQF